MVAHLVHVVSLGTPPLLDHRGYPDVDYPGDRKLMQVKNSSSQKRWYAHSEHLCFLQ